VAITRACERAFPIPVALKRLKGEKLKAWRERLSPEQRIELDRWRSEYLWHPNQIRHARGTAVRKKFGLEAAQVALGHERADVTQVYAERNLELATEVATAMG